METCTYGSGGCCCSAAIALPPPLRREPHSASSHEVLVRSTCWPPASTEWSSDPSLDRHSDRACCDDDLLFDDGGVLHSQLQLVCVLPVHPAGGVRLAGQLRGALPL